MMNQIQKVLLKDIMDMTERLTKHEGHPDLASKWYSVQQLINTEIGKRMLQIREKERDKKNGKS